MKSYVYPLGNINTDGYFWIFSEKICPHLTRFQHSAHGSHGQRTAEELLHSETHRRSITKGHTDWRRHTASFHSNTNIKPLAQDLPYIIFCCHSLFQWTCDKTLVFLPSRIHWHQHRSQWASSLYQCIPYCRPGTMHFPSLWPGGWGQHPAAKNDQWINKEDML